MTSQTCVLYELAKQRFKDAQKTKQQDQKQETKAQGKTVMEKSSVVEKWQGVSEIMLRFGFKDRQEEFDLHMLKMQKNLHKIYRLNIYILNKAALKIQHAYFEAKKETSQQPKNLKVSFQVNQSPSVCDLASPAEYANQIQPVADSQNNEKISNPYSSASPEQDIGGFSNYQPINILQTMKVRSFQDQTPVLNYSINAFEAQKTIFEDLSSMQTQSPTEIKATKNKDIADSEYTFREEIQVKDVVVPQPQMKPQEQKYTPQIDNDEKNDNDEVNTSQMHQRYKVQPVKFPAKRLNLYARQRSQERSQKKDNQALLSPVLQTKKAIRQIEEKLKNESLKKALQSTPTNADLQSSILHSNRSVEKLLRFDEPITRNAHTQSQNYLNRSQSNQQEYKGFGISVYPTKKRTNEESDGMTLDSNRHNTITEEASNLVSHESSTILQPAEQGQQPVRRERRGRTARKEEKTKQNTVAKSISPVKNSNGIDTAEIKKKLNNLNVVCSNYDAQQNVASQIIEELAVTTFSSLGEARKSLQISINPTELTDMDQSLIDSNTSHFVNFVQTATSPTSVKDQKFKNYYLRKEKEKQAKQELEKIRKNQSPIKKSNTFEKSRLSNAY